MSGGVTHRIEEAVKALDKGQIKEALYLTEKKGLERHHEWVEQAARSCLAKKDDKDACAEAAKQARDKLQATITSSSEDTSLDGLEDYLKDTPETVELSEVKTDEELYEECEECHVADAVVKASKLCSAQPQPVCYPVQSRVGIEDIEPEEWLKVLADLDRQYTGAAGEEMSAIMNDLTGYLKKRNSPLLKILEH